MEKHFASRLRNSWNQFFEALLQVTCRDQFGGKYGTAYYKWPCNDQFYMFGCFMVKVF